VDAVPVLDRIRLDLITRGNAALAAEFLAALFEEADGMIQRLDGLLAAGDSDGVTDVAHTLKGMAAEVGATQFRLAAATLEAKTESARRPGDIQRLRTALAELRAHVTANP
jgi:HPt (histidine-containing phosphotransfer) domain-containing protein